MKYKDFNTNIRYFLNSFKNSSFFHSEEYFNVIKKTHGYEPLLIVHNRNNSTEGFALGELSSQYKLFSFLTKRTIFYSEPIYKNTDTLDLILKEIKKQKAGVFIQIRPFRELDKGISEIYFKNGFRKIPHLNAFIELNDIDLVFKNFDKDKRRGINIAEKKYKITIKEPENITFSVKTFYEIVSKLFKKNNLGLKSYDYFLNLVNLSNGKARIAFAYYMDKPIATQLFTVYNDKITALYTATLKEHNNKHAGDLLIWYLINLGFKYKLNLFDFGGAGNPNRPYPPREYKKRFAAVFEDVGRYSYFKYPFSEAILNYYYKYTS